MSKLLSDIRMDFGGLQTWVSQQWTQRVVQVSVYAAVVFFLLSNYSLIQVVEKSVKSVSGLKLGNEGTLVLHSVIFGLFMYVGTRFILDPMVGKVVEGQTDKMDKENFLKKVADLNIKGHVETKDEEEFLRKIKELMKSGDLNLIRSKRKKETGTTPCAKSEHNYLCGMLTDYSDDLNKTGKDVCDTAHGNNCKWNETAEVCCGNS